MEIYGQITTQVTFHLSVIPTHLICHDETNATGADGSNVNVQVTGNTNTMTLNHAYDCTSSNLRFRLDCARWITTYYASIDVDGATNYMDIDGDDNVVPTMEMDMLEATFI